VNASGPTPLARLVHLDGLSRAPEWGDGIRGKLRARLTEWHGFLGRQPEIARQILRKLLVGRLVLTPDATARTYTVQGRATYGRLLEGIIRVGGLVPPGWSADGWSVRLNHMPGVSAPPRWPCVIAGQLAQTRTTRVTKT
jgi:hypothetical protein